MNGDTVLKVLGVAFIVLACFRLADAPWKEELALSEDAYERGGALSPQVDWWTENRSTGSTIAASYNGTGTFYRSETRLPVRRLPAVNPGSATEFNPQPAQDTPHLRSSTHRQPIEIQPIRSQPIEIQPIRSENSNGASSKHRQASADLTIKPFLPTRAPEHGQNQKPLPTPLPSLRMLKVKPQVEARVLENLKYGKSLTRRRAYFAAKAELTQALMLIAKSHDKRQPKAVYSERFSAALTALDEMEDFADIAGGKLDRKGRATRIASHSSNLIAPHHYAQMEPQDAISIYCQFAGTQLVQAIGYSRAGSEVLHALGRLLEITPVSERAPDPLAEVKTLVFFRAALGANPRNATCANDLGVHLFELGRPQGAIEAFKQAVSIERSPQAWSNLAAVHNHLALDAPTQHARNYQSWLSELARVESQTVHATPDSNFQWATVGEFNQQAAFPAVVVQGIPQQAVSGAGILNQQIPADVSRNSNVTFRKTRDWF